MNNRIVSLDLIRGLAALLVCAGHLRAFVFVNWSEVESPKFATKIFYFITGLGHQSVVVFFVLSGFLVGGSVMDEYFRRKWCWKRYLINRLVRLWVVLIPALGLTFFWDIIGGSFFGADLFLERKVMQGSSMQF